jgi:oligopeptidase B
MASSAPLPPVAKQVPAERSHHGDTVIDEFAWLADAKDPEMTAYVAAENAYAESRTADIANLREQIFGEILRRTKEADLSLPVRKGDFWYYQRTVEGQQYGIYCRCPAIPGEPAPPITVNGEPLTGEQLLLDGNVEAGESESYELGALDVSPDGNLLAYSVDLIGAERFTVRVKDLRTGQVLPDEIRGAGYGSAWSADASALFYVTVDNAGRAYQVWRHTVGTETDVLVLTEPDERFWVSVELSRSGAYLLIDVRSTLTSEVHVIPAAAPDLPPRLVATRREGVDYTVDHDLENDRLLILHNDGAEDFALSWTPAAEPGPWHELIPHAPGVRLLAASAFAGAIVVLLRRGGLTGLRVLPTRAETGEPYDISFAEPVYTTSLDTNLEYATDSVRVRYTSMVTPESIYDYNLRSREFVLRRQAPVLGDYRPGDYEQHREWATADDGARIPMSIVCRRDARRDGSAPAVLYAYGAYEECVDPRFSIPRLSLLERGFVFAVAHVRGGGEMGRRWYTEGRLTAKPNTITDLLACARHLSQAGWTSPARLVARGSSAGGLAVGALANLAPDAVAGIVAESPFVDPLTTLLDPALPLTVTEWEEWGNPLESAQAYAVIKSYSPYENVAPARYPAILALASYNDTRVLLREPLKWIARLRKLAPDGHYLLMTEMDAGHGGHSGRYARWREEAFIIAWMARLVHAG